MKKFLAVFIAIMCLSGCYYVDTGVHPNYYARQSRSSHVHHYDSHFYRKETHKVKKPKPAKKDIKPKKAVPKKYEPKAPKKYEPKAPKKYEPKKVDPKKSIVKAGPKVQTKPVNNTQKSYGGMKVNKEK